MRGNQPLNVMKELHGIVADLAKPSCTEVVLQTGRFDEAKAWYEAVFGLDWFMVNTPEVMATDIPLSGKPQVRAADVRSCFAALEGGFTLALFELPGMSLGPTSDPGLNHIQFKYHDLERLVAQVETLAVHGVTPHRTSNHGPITSFYYRDPDQNIVELCVNNYDSHAEFVAFTRSPEFQANPSGIELDHEDFLRRYRAGATRDELRRLS
ncbi:VOC family protein [Rhizorhabdus dicambivorans]|uniref:VOC domain-containing protein n=1 Tax=Rhizorhabdus dicambivorans TaxID=1850238 RepID=A0A2A4FYG2_9SPHN|nr:VOC family protein [Rhizorhabdus dicambivorans]ATE64184.1 hypothetical protein CMV14_07095 [Rhizorhabdus dicambivorans]PCE42544.1 hypothetical protein COO09_08985 [Rhizorhabdus dicambivorans]